MFINFAHSGPKMMPHIIAIARKIFVKKIKGKRDQLILIYMLLINKVFLL